MKSFGHFAAAILSTCLIVRAEPGMVFPSPEAAQSVMMQAFADGKKDGILAVLGNDADALINSGDATYDRFLLGRIRAAEMAQCEIDRWDEGTVFFNIGPDAWQLPIPLLKTENGWVFNPNYDKDEILQKRIRRNEIAAVEICRIYVRAQLQYAGRNGVREYAQKLISSPGTHDGLYWPQAGPTDAVSPLWPLVEKARQEGYDTDPSQGRSPYRGYYYRILTSQGPEAPGGAVNYLNQGRMTGGFALIAWPAKWSDSGKKTFMVNQSGHVWQKDLGAETADRAPKIRSFNPDGSWQLASE